MTERNARIRGLTLAAIRTIIANLYSFKTCTTENEDAVAHNVALAAALLEECAFCFKV